MEARRDAVACLASRIDVRLLSAPFQLVADGSSCGPAPRPDHLVLGPTVMLCLLDECCVEQAQRKKSYGTKEDSPNYPRGTSQRHLDPEMSPHHICNPH